MLVFTANNIIILMSVAVPVNEIVCYIVHAITNAKVRGAKTPFEKSGSDPSPASDAAVFSRWRVVEAACSSSVRQQ